MQFTRLTAKVKSLSTEWRWQHPKISGLFFQVLKRIVSRQKPDGSWTADEPWYIFDRGSSVVAMMHETDTDMLVFTRQYRAGVNEYLVEFPAGMLEEGEDPAVAVVREVFEETGYSMYNSLKCLFRLKLSPGGYTEITHIFYIQTKSGNKTGAGGGLADESESLEVLKISANEAISMIYPQNGDPAQIIDAKTVAALLWLEIQRLKK